MTTFSKELIRKIAPRGRSSITGPLPALLNKHLPNYGITTPKRVALFLANILTETGGFRALEENLNYSAKRLTQVWPSRFRSIRRAQNYARNPEALANKVYNRYGNKGRPGFGWKYRGRGFMQTTFVDNYQDVKRVTGIDVVSNPDLLTDPEMALIAACIYWQTSGCNELADGTQITKARRVINGGTHGLSTVKTYYKRVLPRVRDIKFKREVAKTSTATAGISTAAGAVAATEGFDWTIILGGAGIAVLLLVVYITWKTMRKKKDVQQDQQDLAGLEDIPDQHDVDSDSFYSLDTARRHQLLDDV